MTSKLNAQISEAELQRSLIQLASLRGYMVQHSRKATITRRNGQVVHATPISGHVGYPDLTLCKGGRVAFLELKREVGTPSEDQVQWLNALCGQKLNREHWFSRGPVPDGMAFHVTGGWTSLESAGDWTMMVAVVRPRHRQWLAEVL